MAGSGTHAAESGRRNGRFRLGVRARTHTKAQWWRDVRRRRLLALADVLAGSAIVAICLSSVDSTPSWLWAIASGPAWVVIAKLVGLYDRDHRTLRHLTVDEIGSIAIWAAVGVMTLALALDAGTTSSFSLYAALGAWLAGIFLGVLMRALARFVWRRTTPPEETALIGAGALASTVRRKLALFDDMHLNLCDDRLVTEGMNGARPASLRKLAQSVDRIILSQPTLDPVLASELAEICRAEQTKLSVFSPISSPAAPQSRMSSVAHLPVLEFDTWDVSRATLLMKRATDVAVASMALALLLPLFPLVALAIRLDSRGAAIYGQLRAGRSGRPFRMLKLRTMRLDAEQMLPSLVSFDELDEPVFKVKSDPRITRVGRLLRRLSIDELPQLVNVLRGEMSLVGPRPEQVELVELYEPEHRIHLELRPGVTGPMQVFGRADLPFTSRLAMESEYVQNLSVGRDLRILMQTVPATLRGRGAY